jgi:hypothetical protein
MKPTPQVSPDNRPLRGENGGTKTPAFPLTDYAFQTAPTILRAPSAVAEKKKAEMRTFRKVSRDFFGAEMTRDYVAEALLFCVITGVTAWPMGIAIHQLTRWMI